VYKLFTFLRSGTHTMTKKDGKTKEVNCEFYECKLKQCGGCRVKNCEAIKVVMKGTGGLLRHVKACRGDAVYDDVRSSSKSSNVYKGPDGQLVEQLTFKELLPHHVRFVIFCFTHWDHFSKTRAPEFLEFVQGWDPRAGLPARETCVRILFLIQHMIRKKLTALYALVRAQLGSPFCGMLDDIWSKRNCKQSFACARTPLALDGALLDKFVSEQTSTSCSTHVGTIVRCSPVLSFATLPSSRHTGHVLARWKKQTLATMDLTLRDISCATEDGASNNRKCNRVLRMPSMVCFPHNLQRCVLIASGLTGRPCQNKEVAAFQKQSNKMVGSFSKSGVATTALFDSQKSDTDWHKVLSLASPNATRWLGLHRQAMRNRMLQPNIAEALCGDKAGKEDVAEDEMNLVEVPNTFTLLASAASPPASPPLGISPPRPSLVSSLSLLLLCLRSSLTTPTPTALILVLTRTMSQ